MARTVTRDGEDLPADPPAEVLRVTIVKDGRSYAVGEPTGRRARFLVTAALVLALAAGWAIAAGVLKGGPTVPVDDSLRLERPMPGLSRVADVYRYPLGCLGSTLSARRSGYAAARLDRAGPCWRYGVYVIAILHRAQGGWRLSLEAISATCPTVQLPAIVRAQLAICHRPIVQAPRRRSGSVVAPDRPVF